MVLLLYIFIAQEVTKLSPVKAGGPKKIALYIGHVEKFTYMLMNAGSVGESNRFGCCGFSCTDLRCKFKLHLIEGGWN